MVGQLRDCWRIIECVALAALVGGCDRNHGQEAGVVARPSIFRFLVSISQENPETEASRLMPIQTYLRSQLNLPVQVIGSSGYGVAIEALRAKKIEACTMGPFAYLIAAEKAGAEVTAMRGALDGTPAGYSGGLAVASTSWIHTIEDVVRHSKELTVSFVDPASASGNLVQRAYLDSVGLDPERDFKRVVFSQNHLTSALTLLAGKADVAAIGETIVPALVRSHQVREGEIRYLWISPRIPEGPVVVRKDLPEDLKGKLREALIRMRALAPEAYLNMTAKIYRERYRNTEFVPATDILFDPLRTLARGVKQSRLLE
jgi:phosphonate transport system substrate-binding protein